MGDLGIALDSGLFSWRYAPKLSFEGLCKMSFAACGGKIFFGCRRLFPDFAKQNQEKDVCIQI